MNCELVNNHIEALTLNDIKLAQHNNIIAHIKNCSDCEKVLQQHHAYLVSMSRLETPELTDELAATMLAKATHKKTKTSNNDSSFLQGFIAASVLVASIFGAFNLYTTSPEFAPVEVATNEENDYFITEVILVINAPEDMYDADLAITLPQHIALEGYDNMQELSWPVDLKAGTNTLSLPIRVNKHQANQQPLSIMAKLYHYAEEREFEIKVDVNKMQSINQKSVKTVSDASPQLALASYKTNITV